MKKFLLFIVLIFIGLFAFMKFVTIPRAEHKIISLLEETGFDVVSTKEIAFTLNGLIIKQVFLDKDEFNNAENIDVFITWPSYLIGGDIGKITIETLQLSLVMNRPKDILSLKTYVTHDVLKKISSHHIDIKNLILDVALPQKALRFTGNVEVIKDIDRKGQNLIKANLNPSQHDLSFNSQWRVEVNKDDFLMEAVFESLSAHSAIANLKRGSGFLTIAGGTDNVVTMQIDAGSGQILDLPLRDVSFILNQTNRDYPATLRAKAANLENINLYGDFVFSNIAENQQFDLVAEIENPTEFVKAIKNTKTSNFSIPQNPLRIATRYQAKDRFANGPLPFALNVQNQETNDNELNGTFLIYPDSLDVRGAAQGDQSAINFLGMLFNIDQSRIGDDSIRFDENLKNLKSNSQK